MTKYNLKKIEGAGYLIMITGEVFSLGTNWRGYGTRAMKQYKDSRGYLRVSLRIDGKQKQYPIHRLIALKFLPKQPHDKPHIRHLDGNMYNNHPDNLRWGTSKDNATDRTKHGRCTASKNAKDTAWLRAGTGLGVRRSGRLWRAQISMYGVPNYLGYFKTRALARKAYLGAAKKYKKERFK